MNTFLRRQLIKIYERTTGRRILSLMNKLADRQWSSKAELLKRQKQKLHNLLMYAYHNVPYYHNTFDQVGFHPDEVLSDLASLHKLPILTKDKIRENFDDLLTIEPQKRAKLISANTGGSSGQPLRFMIDENFRDHFTAYVHHHLTWGGWQFGQPNAYIGGVSFGASSKKSLRNQLMDWLFNRFSMNAYVLNDESMHAFAKLIHHKRPTLLYGYASSLYYFAQFARQTNIKDIKLEAVFSSAEVMYPQQRQFIEETFETKVYDRYATRELGEIGSQCKAQTGLHLSVENVYLEILNDNGLPTQPGETGYITVTNLTNYGMPFIRYNLADTAAWYPEHTCPCGRSHPMLSPIEGRQNDMFKSRDGRIVWGGIANPLWDVPSVKQFQFIQKNYDLVLVRIVTQGELPVEVLNKVENAIHTALDEQVEVQFEFPDEITLSKSGKYRYQICEIQPDATPSILERGFHP